MSKPPSKEPHKKKDFSLFDLIMVSLFPLLVGKSFVLYFGINYTNYPGEGYGVALSIAIAFSVVMAGRFLWRYRDYED